MRWFDIHNSVSDLLDVVAIEVADNISIGRHLPEETIFQKVEGTYLLGASEEDYPFLFWGIVWGCHVVTSPSMDVLKIPDETSHVFPSRSGCHRLVVLLQHYSVGIFVRRESAHASDEEERGEQCYALCIHSLCRTFGVRLSESAPRGFTIASTPWLAVFSSFHSAESINTRAHSVHVPRIPCGLEIGCAKQEAVQIPGNGDAVGRAFVVDGRITLSFWVDQPSISRHRGDAN